MEPVAGVEPVQEDVAEVEPVQENVAGVDQVAGVEPGEHLFGEGYQQFNDIEDEEIVGMDDEEEDIVAINNEDEQIVNMDDEDRVVNPNGDDALHDGNEDQHYEMDDDIEDFVPMEEDEDDDVFENGFNNYLAILTELSRQWILIEVDHRVSKQASEEFWRLANDLFPKLYDAKGDRGRKIPQFCHIRRKLYEQKVPPVKMEIAYKSKETGEVTVVANVTKTPVSRFPANTHRRLYEIASVDVSCLDLFNMIIDGSIIFHQCLFL